MYSSLQNIKYLAKTQLSRTLLKTWHVFLKGSFKNLDKKPLLTIQVSVKELSLIPG
jgi:hypothetical protein